MDKDRHGDIILPTAFDDGLTDYIANSVILLQHKSDKPIGRATVIEARPDGLYIEAEITQNTDNCMDQIEEWILKGFSIWFNVPEGGYDYENQIITSLKLLEISIVSIPSNPKTLMKSLQFAISELEKVNKHADAECENPDDCPDCEECSKKRKEKKDALDAQLASLPQSGEAISTESAVVVEDCGCDAEPDVSGDGIAIEISAESADPKKENAENAQVERFYEIVARSISTLSQQSISNKKSYEAIVAENSALRSEIENLKSLDGRIAVIEKTLAIKANAWSLANIREVKKTQSINYADGARLLSK